MSKKRKYIIIEVLGKFGCDTKVTPVLFSDDFIHSNVARGIKSTFSGRSYQVVSAGFYRIDNGKVICYGRSESLDLDSRPKDAEIIAKELGIENYTVNIIVTDHHDNNPRLNEKSDRDCIEEKELADHIRTCYGPYHGRKYSDSIQSDEDHTERKRGIDSEDIHRQVEEARLDNLAEHIVQNQLMFKNLIKRLSLGSLLSINTISDTKEIIKKLLRATQVPDPELLKSPTSMGSLYSDFFSKSGSKKSYMEEVKRILGNELGVATIDRGGEYLWIDSMDLFPTPSWMINEDFDELINDTSGIGYITLLGPDGNHVGNMATTVVRAAMHANGIEVVDIKRRMDVCGPTVFEFKEEQLPPKFKSFPEQMEELKRKNSRFNSSFNKRKKHGRKK